MQSNAQKSLDLQSVTSLFKGFFQFKKLQFKHSLYRGGETVLIERELFSRGQAVVILLYDVQHQQVVLVEQCRVGAVEHALHNNDIDQAWLVEPVAGMIDSDESAEQAAIREVREETGISIDEIEYICQFYPSPGACDETLLLYASQINSLDIATHAGMADESEDIKVVKLSFKEAKQKLLTGQFNVASTYMALQWLFFQKLTDCFQFKTVQE